ncbi:hypothetical protein MNAN1_002149 [Malassezia nana]|uniref:Uncharacterized protein n=1 Tax=Malassezia nana TaxID=180528 RepID=A0AAF0EML6_9BASI|nr:hypothetical protein MNAN1_002149 [Malassezia nana]
MSLAPPTACAPEEYARRLSAVAMTAWRDRRMKLARPAGSSRAHGLPPRTSDTLSIHELGCSIDAQKRSSAGRHDTLASSDNEERSQPMVNADMDDSDGPMLIECDYGMLLVYPVHLPRKSGPDERRRIRRLLRPPPSQQGSRRPSFAHSSCSLSGETSSAKSVLQNLRSATSTDEPGDAVCSTEDDTDLESLRSEHALKTNTSSLILVLNADASSISTLWQQARAFAECSRTGSPPWALQGHLEP